MPRTVLWRLAALALPLATAGLGLLNGPGDYRNAQSTAQRLVAASAITYGMLGAVTAVAIGFGAPVGRRLLVAWSISFTLTGAMAPVVWAGSSLWSGALAGLVCAALSGLWIWLGARALPVVR